ncbi:hypothetical protein SmJEL517_g05024 [Synchytrium microbalum]|uniref:Major facilitator superfamily (MFS) profile domain-containing protein n=1 Tax=Synchytrium microbalum TaxID=1806994 RepID=A0A507C112_9FUNG|nr:uncharacterized protein SmJEL517_g05024 [Synchytrium microbalum]TPX31744.1 hypothetical protein SmJEL517_g05024 [Synchytrium microbalum]
MGERRGSKISLTPAASPITGTGDSSLGNIAALLAGDSPPASNPIRERRGSKMSASHVPVSLLTAGAVDFEGYNYLREYETMDPTQTNDDALVIPRMRRKSNASELQSAGRKSTSSTYRDFVEPEAGSTEQVGKDASYSILSPELAAVSVASAMRKSFESKGDAKGGSPPIPESEFAEWKFHKRFNSMQKLWIVGVVSFTALLLPMSTTFYYPAVVNLQNDLQTTDVVINASITVYVLLVAVGPLFLAPISDVYGRRIVYLVSTLLFFVTSIMLGFISSVWQLFLLRALQALGCSPVLAIGAGIVGDVFPVHQRGRAMGAFLGLQIVGPIIGPMLGGVITGLLNWRSLFWVLAGLGFVAFVLVFFFLPETFVPVGYDHLKYPPITMAYLLKNPFKRRVLSPVGTLAVMYYPSVWMVTAFACASFAALYFLNTSIARDYQSLYGFSALESGLVYMAMGLGLMFGSAVGGWAADFFYERARKASKTGQVAPESRLPSSLIGASIVPIGLLLHGWLLTAGAPWWGPCIGQFIYGFGQLIAVTTTATYLVELFQKNASGVIATNNFIRGLFGAVAALVITPLESAVGAGWSFTIAAAGTVFGGLCVLLVFMYGEIDRQRYERWNPSVVNQVKNT